MIKKIRRQKVKHVRRTAVWTGRNRIHFCYTPKLLTVKVKVKVKFTLEQTTKVQRGRGGVEV